MPCIGIDSRGIRENCICSAMVWTDQIMQNEVTLEQLQGSEINYPLKRKGKAEGVAYLARYLLFEASSWMINSNLDLTGVGQ